MSKENSCNELVTLIDSMIKTTQPNTGRFDLNRTHLIKQNVQNTKI